MLNFIRSLFTKKKPVEDIKIEIEEKYISVKVDGEESPLAIRRITIPVGGASKEDVDMLLTDLISDYKKDLNFDEITGEVKINDETFIPYKKEIWIPATK